MKTRTRAARLRIAPVPAEAALLPARGHGSGAQSW